ncbi:hypothetical protein [Dyella sp. C11]|uniref:hypothetical protein n=1 Tax=Dyella sp. C11 TaxID=2126991 RepID=UPI000D65ACD8|nr:hypothetical protein [Dyella sp. C11]
MRIGKNALLLVLAFWCGAASASYDVVISTPKRVIVVVVKCQEGDVNCNDIKLTEVEKTTGKTRSLEGTDWVRLCQGSETPCQHIGFKFPQAGQTIYVGDDDKFSVIDQHGKEIDAELGKRLEP